MSRGGYLRLATSNSAFTVAVLAVILIMPGAALYSATDPESVVSLHSQYVAADSPDPEDPITWAPPADITAKQRRTADWTNQGYRYVDFARVDQNVYVIAISWNRTVVGTLGSILELYRSTDGGCTWSPPDHVFGDWNLGLTVISVCAYRNGTADDVLIVAKEKVLKSTDSGLSFSRLTDLPYETLPYPVNHWHEWTSVDAATNASWSNGQRSDDDIYVVGCRKITIAFDGGYRLRTSVTKSTDGGLTWTYSDIDPRMAYPSAQIACDGEVLCVVYPSNPSLYVWKSTDWARTWSLAKIITPSTSVPSPYIHSTNLEVIDSNTMSLSYIESSPDGGYADIGSFGCLLWSNLTYIELERLDSPNWRISDYFRGVTRADLTVDIVWIRLKGLQDAESVAISMTRGVFGSNHTRFGLLRVHTNPDLHSVIRMNGFALASNATEWVTVVPWTYVIEFGSYYGWDAPKPLKTSIRASQSVSIEGNFTRLGHLTVSTSPALPSTIYVDGIPRNDWVLSADVRAGHYNVSFGDVEGYTTPSHVTVEVVAGENTSVVGEFLSSPGALGPDPSSFGYLRLYTEPAIKTMIFLDGHWMSYWGLDWAKLSPGEYELTFSDVDEFIAPPPMTLRIQAALLTEMRAPFSVAANLRVQTSAPVNGTIYIDGVPRNSWGLWMDLDASEGYGNITLSFGDVQGYLTPGPLTLNLVPEERRSIIVSYVALK